MEIYKISEGLGQIIKAPEHVGIDITSRCNMQCLHCFNRSSDTSPQCIPSEELSDLELFKLINEINNLQPPSLCFCGGEPLLRFKLILELLKILNNGITKVSMVSNGFLLTKNMAAELVSHGLHNLQISIDGANAATHEKMRGVKGCYKRAIAAVKYMSEVGMQKRSVAFSPTSFNIHEFPLVAEQMNELNVNQLRVQPLMNLGNALTNPDIFPSISQYHTLHSYIIEQRKKYPNMPIEWGDPIDHLIRFSGVLTYFVPYITIRSNGSIVLSPYLPITIGNIRKHSIQQYWDEGIQKIWSIKCFQDIANYISSTYDFSRQDIPVPLVYHESFVDFDLIDDKLFHLTNQQINNLYWERIVSNESEGVEND